MNNYHKKIALKRLEEPFVSRDLTYFKYFNYRLETKHIR